MFSHVMVGTNDPERANGGTIGFYCATPELVRAFHEAGLSAGGTAIEDPPGPRASGLHLGYLRDPDGNKVCALHRPTPPAS